MLEKSSMYLNNVCGLFSEDDNSSLLDTSPDRRGGWGGGATAADWRLAAAAPLAMWACHAMSAGTRDAVQAGPILIRIGVGIRNVMSPNMGFLKIGCDHS